MIDESLIGNISSVIIALVLMDCHLITMSFRKNSPFSTAAVNVKYYSVTFFMEYV
jgi:hypothetical protein